LRIPATAGDDSVGFPRSHLLLPRRPRISLNARRSRNGALVGRQLFARLLIDRRTNK
jgi:hypothetical protein